MRMPKYGYVLKLSFVLRTKIGLCFLLLWQHSEKMYFVFRIWQISSIRSTLVFYLIFQHGNTALHESSWRGFSRTVDLLCRNKSNFYLRNRGGFSALHLCCQNGHNETCRVLLRAGCKPNIKNNVRPYYLWVVFNRREMSGKQRPRQWNKN